MNEEKINRVLIAADASNFEYVVLNSAFSKWCKTYPDDSSFIRSAEETDQDNLPNLLVIDSFKRVLHKVTQDKLEAIEWIAKNNHQTEIDLADGIDVVFTEDGDLSGNFRKKEYPQYKAQRKLVKHQYDKSVLKDYIQNVIFKELEIESRLGYKMIRVENCESDDIIAVLMNRYENYMCRILISSDHDFLQLEGVNQYDMWGNKIERKIRNHDDFTMTSNEFLYWKILRGDVSDNIKNVFPKVGDVKSYKLIKNRPLLNQMLKESQEAANRFILNKKLIDFREIPTETEEKIFQEIQKKMNIKSEKEKVEEFTMEGCMEL